MKLTIIVEVDVKNDISKDKIVDVLWAIENAAHNKLINEGEGAPTIMAKVQDQKE